MDGPRGLTGILEIEAAVLVPRSDTVMQRGLVPRSVLCRMVRETRKQISEYMGDHNIDRINGEQSPLCGDTGGFGGEHGKSKSERKSTSVPAAEITGAVIGSLLVLLLIAFILYFFRYVLVIYFSFKPRFEKKMKNRRELKVIFGSKTIFDIGIPKIVLSRMAKLFLLKNPPTETYFKWLSIKAGTLASKQLCAN